jgi:two-component system chemotaxis response regulator CheV
MSSLLNDITQHTQLAGHNRLELLLFHLGTEQRFAINVFKVREVIVCPALSWVPNAHPSVSGIADIRGNTILMIDLGVALGRQPIEDPEKGFAIVSEFNRTVQGFVVNGVDRIINVKWEDMLTPPNGLDENHYLTAITHMDNKMIEVLDVERIIAEVIGTPTIVSSKICQEEANAVDGVRHVLVVDDSSVARNQIIRAMKQIGVECTTVKNGREALDLLKQWANEGTLSDRLAMVISDIEMPVMDGYTLTTKIREDQSLQNLYVLLHSSLSGVFNEAMVTKVGADEFIAKFVSDELAKAVLGRIHRESVESSMYQH